MNFLSPQLFLLHIDEIISTLCGKDPFGGLLGATTVCCDEEKVRRQWSLYTQIYFGAQSVLAELCIVRNSFHTAPKATVSQFDFVELEF